MLDKLKSKWYKYGSMSAFLILPSNVIRDDNRDIDTHCIEVAHRDINYSNYSDIDIDNYITNNEDDSCDE